MKYILQALRQWGGNGEHTPYLEFHFMLLCMLL